MAALFKKWLGMIAMTLTTSVLVACGGGVDDNTDTTAPTTTAAPSVSDTTANSTTLSATINEAGTGYYLVQPAAAVAPTVAAVLAGSSFAMTANVAPSVNISGLSVSTDYRIYFVAKDAANNVQAAVQSVALTSTAAPDRTEPSLASTDDLGTANIGDSVSHTLTFDENIAAVSAGAVPAGMTVTASKSGNSVTLQIATAASFTAFGNVMIPVTVSDAAGNVRSISVSKTINDLAPVENGAFALLQTMNITDGAGFSTTLIDAGGVTDPLGRTITYSMTWAVTSVFAHPDSIAINSATGQISYLGDETAPITYTFTVTASNGSSSISKSFVVNVRDIG